MAKGRRSPEFGTGVSAAVVISFASAAAVAYAVLAWNVPGTANVSHAFGLVSFPFAMVIFVLARHLYAKTQRNRESALLAEDGRSRASVTSAINLCRALALGAWRRSARRPGDPDMPAMSHLAEGLGLVRSQYGHVLSRDGRRKADYAWGTALGVIDGSDTCSPAAFSTIADELYAMGDEILPLDDPQLEDRRRRMAES